MKRQTVSLCLLARNQESTIGTAIKSVLALVDEVVVVDLGSTDNTRIIAEGYGARVLDFSWSDDFAAARNAGLDEASCHWALVMDAHEFLQPIRPVEFQRLLHDPGVAGYRMFVGNGPTGDPREGRTALRLFRLAPEIRYRYPIFEQLEPALSAWAYPQGLIISQVDLAVMTNGEHQEGPSRQRETSMRILRKALDAHPGEPYFPYRLACENIHEWEGEVLPVAGLNRALGHLSQSWRLISKLPSQKVQELGWVPDLAIKAASGLGTLGRAGEAGPLIRRVRQLFPRHPGVCLQAIATEIALLKTSRPPGDQENHPVPTSELEATLQSLRLEGQKPGLSAADKRVYSLYPLRYLGEMALLEGRVSEAVGHFEQALSLDPEYSFAWLGMAECSRFAGDKKRALKLYLRTVTESEWNYRAWLRGCDLMLEMGFGDNAASWWHRAGTSFPEHPEVLAGIADASGREPALQING